MKKHKHLKRQLTLPLSSWLPVGWKGECVVCYQPYPSHDPGCPEDDRVLKGRVAVDGYGLGTVYEDERYDARTGKDNGVAVSLDDVPPLCKFRRVCVDHSKVTRVA